MRTMRIGQLVLALAWVLFGCGSEDEKKDGAAAPLEIIGDWSSEFGDESITESTWGTTAVKDYDNDQNVVIVQNPDDDAFSPSAFAKIVFTEPKNDEFYYCWVDFGLESLADAQASDKSADDSEPDTAGCGDGNPWTKLTKK